MQCRERMASLLTLTGLAHEMYRQMVIMVEVILLVSLYTRLARDSFANETAHSQQRGTGAVIDQRVIG